MRIDRNGCQKRLRGDVPGSAFIHMNGRVYSPNLGRMLSPDPVTQAPENGQNYNRYTYAFNNPLKFTDPSGYNGVSCTIFDFICGGWSAGGANTDGVGFDGSSWDFVAMVFADFAANRGENYEEQLTRYDYWAAQATGDTKNADGGPTSTQCVVDQGGCAFNVTENPDANGSAPWYEFDVFSQVDTYSDIIDRVAAETGVDAVLIQAVMYVETTHGYYDLPASLFDLNKSILPMNINTDFWGDVWGTRESLSDPYVNITAGALILQGITANLPFDASIAQIATLYNNLNATTVSDYGARVESVSLEQPWEAL